MKKSTSYLQYNPKTKLYELSFLNYEPVQLRLCELISIHNKLKNIELDKLINDLSDKADVHYFRFEKNNILFVLSLTELVKFYLLFEKTMYHFKLEDTLYSLGIVFSTDKIETELPIIV